MSKGVNVAPEIVLRDNGLHPEILRVQETTVLRWTNNDAQNTP